jgi:hypothetical protein
MREAIASWVMAHPTTAWLILYWLFSNVVSAMPSPTSQVSFYRFVFNLMSGLAGSVGRISPALRIPNPAASSQPTNGGVAKP